MKEKTLKSLKSAAMQFLSDVRGNRCMILSYRDAIDGLSFDDANRITRCYYRRDTRTTTRLLLDLIDNLESISGLEYIITLHVNNGEDVKISYKSEVEALKEFRNYILDGKKASLSVASS